MAKKAPKRKPNTKKVLIKKLLKELIRKPRRRKISKLRNKTSKVIKKNEKQEPVSSETSGWMSIKLFVST